MSNRGTNKPNTLPDISTWMPFGSLTILLCRYFYTVLSQTKFILQKTNVVHLVSTNLLQLRRSSIC